MFVRAEGGGVRGAAPGAVRCLPPPTWSTSSLTTPFPSSLTSPFPSSLTTSCPATNFAASPRYQLGEGGGVALVSVLLQCDALHALELHGTGLTGRTSPLWS